MAAQSTTGEASATSLSQNNTLTMNRGAEVSKAAQKVAQPSLTTSTSELYTKMLNPIMKDMEKATMKSSKLLDNIDRQLTQEREERVKRNRSAHIPEVLKGGGLDSDEVLRKVEQLIFFAEKEDGTVQLQDHIRLRELEPEGKTGLVAGSLRAYMSTLPEQELKRVVSKISADCQLWLSRLLRFENACVTYHEEEREGLVRVCRLALYLRYPKYATDGFDALYSRPPVIYLSAAAPPDLPRFLCLQLGLPLSSISTVPCNTLFGASRKMDVAMLEKLIQDDIAAAKTPVLLLAYAGTPSEGHVDNIQRLQEVCHTHSIWLHLQGNCLATLPFFSEASEMAGAITGDSITITPGPWIGVPGLPSATLFKASDVTLVHAAGLNTFNTCLKLNGLPMWMSLLALGHQGVVDRVTHCCHLAKLMCDKLSQISSIKLISRAKSEASSEGKPLMQTLSKALSPLTVFEMASPTVVFRFATEIVDDSLLSPYDMRQTDGQTEATSDAAYFDALNIWLHETLEGSDPRVAVDTVVVEKEGVCLRFSPVETAQASGTTEKDIEEFVVSLLSSLAVLNASTRQRRHFQNLVHAQSNLILLTVPNWAGLGAVSYIPDMYQGKEELREEELDTIDALNYDILQELKAKDSAFSLGETEAGRICVKFGLITEDTNVQELVELVQAAGEEIEDSSKFMDNMTEMIQKGIEAANQALQKEQENKLVQEGVLRQIPMVGSMLNWLQPIKEDVKGRTFSLASGHMRSTEETYRHHMQVQEEGEAVALAPLLSSRRSRTSSVSSTTSSLSRQTSAQASLSPDAHIGTPAQTS